MFQLFYLERTKNFHFRNKTNSTFNKTNSDSSGEIANLTKSKIYCTLRGTRSRLEEIWWLTISQIIDETKSANRTKDFLFNLFTQRFNERWKVRQIQQHKKRASANLIVPSFATFDGTKTKHTTNTQSGKIYYFILMIIQYYFNLDGFHCIYFRTFRSC